MQLSTHLSRPCRHRLVVGLLAVLLACAPLVACSSDSDDNPLSIPTYDPGAAASAEASESAAAGSASASAAASVSAAAPTPESLSDQELGYHMVSIPKDLTEAQTKALVDYVAYDQVTWRIWSTGQGIENLPAVATGDALVTIEQDARALNGLRLHPPLRVTITEVSVADDGTYAELNSCSDRTQVTVADADGNDITGPDYQGYAEYHVIMVPGPDGNWLTTAETTVSNDKCTAE
ncbi:hypothetical protein GZ998_11860 [Actinomyces sp. 594]|uniref:hypothetical protein n=1 Tax=Actinomyces sp. 594 TaxID=2057793 RepID=UPI001C56AF9D|nr:hypothetical protein [Actinomyces sp. 594]MBW3070193.1 hypothetical protein [Actinomyces sp. 594]